MTLTDWLVTMIMVFAFILIGMDTLTKIHPLANRVWRWLLNNVVYRPIRWVGRHTLRFAGRLLRWSSQQARRGLRYLSRQLGRGLRSLWARISLSRRVVIAVTLSVVAFITLTILGNWMAGNISNWSLPFPLSYLWWGLGIGAALAIVIWVLSSSARRATAGSLPIGRWLWTTVKVVAILVITAYAGYSLYHYTAPAPVVVVTTGADYTEFAEVVVGPSQPLVVTVPPSYQADYWRDTEETVKETVRRGRDLVDTISAKGEYDSIVTFRLFLCTPATNCVE